MALNSSGPISLAGSTTGQSIAVELGQGATSQISLNDAAVRSLAGIASGAITMPTNFWGKSVGGLTQKGIFAFGYSSLNTNITNLVSNTGVVSGDSSGVGTARNGPGGASYGGDKGIIAFGDLGSARTNIKNLVSNTGILSSDESGVGTARNPQNSACTYGTDKAIIAWGDNASNAGVQVSNLISNTGIVASDTAIPSGVSVRRSTMASSYGGDKGIFAFGRNTATSGTLYMNISNKVSNTGVIQSDTAGVGSISANRAASAYGGDKCIFGYGFLTAGATSVTNLVSNTGVVSSDTAGVGTARANLAATSYGGDKGIFGYGNYVSGYTPVRLSMTNKVSNTGVVSGDTAGVGTARSSLAALGYSFS